MPKRKHGCGEPQRASVAKGGAGNQGENLVAGLLGSILECDQTPALGDAGAGETEGIRRIIIRITCHRRRLQDRDNNHASIKDLLDGLRHAGLIPDDDEKSIALQVEQKRVERGLEGTEVEIIY